METLLLAVCFVGAIVSLILLLSLDDPGAIPPADDDYSATTVGRHSHQRGRMSERRERKAS